MKRMENNYHQGDLADVIGATGTNNNGATLDWQFGAGNNPMGYYSVVPSSSEDFGDPFINILRDPDLLHHIIDTPATAGDSNGSINPSEDLPHHHQEIKKRPPSNIFSRISPKCDPPTSMPAAATGLKIIAPTLIPNDHHATANLISSKSCLLGGESRLQIPSTPPSTVIKRRKSETKKVVCIPAPAAANSRASGEVVPSDLWAWRKYGQKPIKGSPYPRNVLSTSINYYCYLFLHHFFN